MGKKRILLKKVENLIKRCDECKLKECINCETNYTEITSIKRIVDSYKRLLKENKELRENYICAQANANQVFDILKNYVPVQTIKAKIEELDIEISACEYADDDSEEYKQEVEKDKAELLMAKKVLQQLLESEEEK